MKLRRALLAFIVIAGFLVLALGVTGVLAPKRQEPSKTGGPGGAHREDVTENLEIQGETWLLKAAEARPREGGGMDLVKPSLEVTQAGAAGEERLTVQAAKGSMLLEPTKSVRMSGDVRIEFAGAEKVVLTTPSVEMEPDQGTGRTTDDIEMTVDTKEGRQHVWGKGAEINSKQRLIVISKDVRMELSGGSSGLFPPATGASPSAPPAGGPPTKIECRGPATADGFKRTVDLEGDVRVQQGVDRLRADHVEVQFAEKSRTPERFVAEGAVTFNASGAEGACDRLARDAAEDQLLLEGNPARVHRGPNEIEAARIELSGRQGVIVVPVPGSLKLAGETAAAGKPAEGPSVKWARMFRLDPNEHQALFLGDVHFERGDQTIECQTLTVKLDSQNRQILECKADTDVHVASRLQGESVTAQARELAYDPQKDSLVLSGRAALQQGQRTIRGERIEVHPKDASIAVAGAGVLEGREEQDSDSSSPAGAAELRSAGPFNISWQREMQFSRARQSAVFQGGVGLKYGGYTLNAENVTARLSGDALKSFDAKGGVDLVQAGLPSGNSGRTLKADSLSAEIGPDRKPGGLDASGHVVATWEETKPEHLIRTLTADRVVSATDEKAKLQSYVATGHVALREDAGPKGIRTMRGERMKAKVDAENRLAAFEAEGRPMIVEEAGRVAYGDRLTWDAQADSGVLFGSPAELRLGQSRLYGDRLQFAPKRGAISVISDRRVEATVSGGAPGTTGTLP